MGITVRDRQLKVLAACDAARRMTNDEVRALLYHARLYLVTARSPQSGDLEAIQLLAGIEMGLAYNVTAPGRGI